jgi:hypothetical protein
VQVKEISAANLARMAILWRGWLALNLCWNAGHQSVWAEYPHDQFLTAVTVRLGEQRVELSQDIHPPLRYVAAAAKHSTASRAEAQSAPDNIVGS